MKRGLLSGARHSEKQRINILAQSAFPAAFLTVKEIALQQGIDRLWLECHMFTYALGLWQYWRCCPDPQGVLTFASPALLATAIEVNNRVHDRSWYSLRSWASFLCWRKLRSLETKITHPEFSLACLDVCWVRQWLNFYGPNKPFQSCLPLSVSYVSFLCPVLDFWQLASPFAPCSSCHHLQH